VRLATQLPLPRTATLATIDTASLPKRCVATRIPFWDWLNSNATFDHFRFDGGLQFTALEYDRDRIRLLTPGGESAHRALLAAREDEAMI